MKTLKKMLCLGISLVLLLNTGACSLKKDDFSHENFCKMAEEFDIDEYEDDEGIFRDINMMSHEAAGYITVKGDRAQEYYDVLINRFKDYEEYKISKFTAIACSDGWQNYFFLMTFESKREASDFFDEYIDQRKVFDDDEDDYSYAISGREFHDDGSSRRQRYDAAYLKDDKVIVIVSITADTTVMEDFCEYLDIIAPNAKARG